MTSPHHPRTWLAGLTALTVVAAMAPAAAATSAPSVPAAPPSTPATSGAASGPAGDETHTLTLITGDVVTVDDRADGTSTVTVAGPHGEAAGGYRSTTIDGDLQVLPDAAMPYIASGVLDADLFNVTELIDQGYADGARTGIPTIVQYSSPKTLAARVTLPDARVTATLESIDGQALEVDKQGADRFWAGLVKSGNGTSFGRGITAVHLDGTVQPDLADSVAQIGAPQAWASGIEGQGITVAVLDTGVDLQHPDLAEAVVDSKSFVPGEGVADVHGHGTHVASTVAGRGTASDGVEKGVAPAADLVVGKVLSDDQGFGLESWIIEGMEWASDEAPVVNMSLGSTEPSDGTDPMAQAVDTLTAEKGTLFVIAAGNYGRYSGIGSPGAAEAALTVGAVDDTDTRAYFQDMGPRLGDALVKPDITGPGVDILAARASLSPGEGFYTTMSGTSMATPHVAGAAALLLQEHPDWDGDQLKDALMSSTVEQPGDGPFEVGTGRVDVPAALDATVTASGPASFGFFAWPNSDAEPVERSITYTNHGDSDVTLDLEVTGGEREGGPLPDGLVTADATSLTVPAGGSSTLHLTADPAIAAPGTTMEGYVVATAEGHTPVRAGWGMVKEDERYSLTLTATDRDGSPGLAYVTVKERDDQTGGIPVTVEGETTLRLPAGTYSAMSFMDVDLGTDHAGVAMLGDPQIELTGDAVVDLDAREANEITVDVPTDGLDVATWRMEYWISNGTGLNENYTPPSEIDHLYAAPTAQVTDGDFEYFTRWRLHDPWAVLTDGDTALDPNPLGGTAYIDGSFDLAAVYAGTGSAADIAGVDVSGKLAVIMRDPALQTGDAVQRLEQAGAKAVVVVNHEPGEFYDFLWTSDEAPIGIPAVGISGTEGAALVPQVQAGGVTLTISGTKVSTVLYDLIDPHDGAIPQDVAYAPTAGELAKVHSRYHGSEPTETGEFRYDLRPFSARGWGFPMVSGTAMERDEWVSTQEGTLWYQDVTQIDSLWQERGIAESYEAGESTQQDWFSAVVHPRLGEGYWLPNRQGDMLQVNLPSWAGSEPGHTGSVVADDGSDQEITWYQGSEVIGESSGWQSDWIDVPTSAKTQYRVKSVASRDASAFDLTPTSTTEWTFWSAGPGPVYEIQTLPFVQVGFDVDVDLTGRATGGQHDTIGYTAWQVPDARFGGTVTSGTLEASFDGGAHWEKLTLTGDPGDWTAKISYPDGAEFVDLRATATDSEGNSIKQTVSHAYRVGVDETEVVVDRLAGDDRYATAVQVSQAREHQGGTVYVATGAGYADALAAAARAGHEDAPVLLTRPTTLPAVTAAELRRIAPDEIVVIGGKSTISGAVVTSLKAIPGAHVTRVAGDDRYGTSVAISSAFEPGVPVLYVASGSDFPDALSGAARAGSLGGPVLLTRSGALPAVVKAEAKRLKPARIVVLGGPTTVGAAVVNDLKTVAKTARISGVDRYETAAKAAADIEPGVPVVYLATGLAYPDALTGSALAAAEDAPILLSRTNRIPDKTLDALKRLDPERVVLLGGESSLSGDLPDVLREALD